MEQTSCSQLSKSMPVVHGFGDATWTEKLHAALKAANLKVLRYFLNLEGKQ
jgi:hypothetical protein